MSKKRTGFRAWFYLRMGYSIYWAFLFMGINTLTVTYFLAIERAPFLKEIFPTFLHYGLSIVIIGVPILVLTGYIHYKKIPGFQSEAEISVEANPYQYKLPPGFWLHVVMPYFRLQSEMLMKISEKKDLTEDEINKMKELQKKMDHLINGGYVGDEARVKSFEAND